MNKSKTIKYTEEEAKLNFEKTFEKSLEYDFRNNTLKKLDSILNAIKELNINNGKLCEHMYYNPTLDNRLICAKQKDHKGHHYDKDKDKEFF